MGPSLDQAMSQPQIPVEDEVLASISLLDLLRLRF